MRLRSGLRAVIPRARAAAEADAGDAAATGAATGLRYPHPYLAAPSSRRALIRFVLASLLVAVGVSGAGAVLSREAANAEALSDARRITQILADSVVAPSLQDALLSADPDDPQRLAAIRALDRSVKEPLVGRSIVRVKLWSADGRVVYADEPRLIGQRFELDDAKRATFADGQPEAGISSLEATENDFERGQGRLLEVYAPVRTPGGATLLFETYTAYDSVAARAGDIWRTFVPIMLGALLILLLMQLPLAWNTARRLDRSLVERERLLRRAVEASDEERRRIARDLHDGVVQDLAATSYSLSTAADRAARNGDPDLQRSLGSASLVVRSAIRSLRTLLVEIYPPSLHRAGLSASLRDLVAPLTGRGVDVDVAVDDVSVPPATAEIVFRVAQEALRNIVSHAAPTHVRIALAVLPDGLLRLEVSDDGVGFDPGTAAEQGHVGLVLLRDLARTAGGRLQAISRPGDGTRVVLDVPLP